MKHLIALFLIFPFAAFAEVLSFDSVQLHELVANSEQQLKAAQELIKYSKQDSASLAKAEQILTQLSTGIDQSVQKYQGTKTYAKALLDAQTEAGFVGGTEDSNNPKFKQKIERFQASSVTANAADLENQDKLQQALNVAQAGFVPKVQAQAQIGAWQTNIRTSAQLTQILATLNGLRSDMKNQNGPSFVDVLISGAQSQSEKLRQGAISGPR